MVLVANAKKPNTVHHKKRSGTHHRQNKDYVKHYWPYLPLLCIVGVGLIINLIWNHQGSSVLGYAINVSAPSLIADTNTQRENYHETALNLNAQLDTAAQNKADSMAALDYWSHDTPSGQTPWSFISATGYKYAEAGENLAYGFTSSDAILNGWMNSPDHRANILNDGFSQVGFGVANASNYQGKGPETIVVAMYAAPATMTAASASTNGQNVNSSDSSVGITSATPKGVLTADQKVARIQVLSPNSASWSLLAITSLGVIALIWFTLRHSLAWKRVLVHGEEFVIHHRLLDVLIVSVAVLGYILTRSVGMIR